MDLILNGQAHGAVATTLLANGFNPAALRPWVGADGRHYVAHNHEGKLISVAQPIGNATLRKDEWKIVDDAVVAAAKERLRFVADLRGVGLTYNLPNGMGKTVLETQTQSDITPATISMDPVRQGEADRPEYDLTSLPLPIIHKDFFFNARQIAVSRNSGAPLDMTMAQLASRRVAEAIEDLALGLSGTFKYGGGYVYGLTNFPQRLTKVMTNPEDSGWTPKTTVTEVLEMRAQSKNAFHYGPWVLYTSPDWDIYLDEDYSDAKGDNTLRDRIKKLEGISDIRSLDHLTGYQMILVQMSSDVVRIVNGMDITTLQWETMGGLQVHFKVMAMMVPQFRSDYHSNTGIVHGVAT